jgi:hypothetical protein
MSSSPHVESESQVLAAITSVTRGRDVLAALAMAWSSSAGQLSPRESDDHQPLPHADASCQPSSTPRVD